MKPSKAALATAKRILVALEIRSEVPLEKIAAIIDEGNKDLVGTTSAVIKACRYPTPAINRQRIANNASAVLANHKPKPE
jgi:hypothetical protein